MQRKLCAQFCKNVREWLKSEVECGEWDMKIEGVGEILESFM